LGGFDRGHDDGMARADHLDVSDDRSTAADDAGSDSGLDVGTVALLVGGMVCYGTATPVSGVVGREFPPLLASFGRLAIAAALLVPLLLHRIRRGEESEVVSTARSLDRADWARLAAIAVIGTFGFSILMLLGMREAPGAVAAVVMATTPGVTAAGAVVFLGDSVSRWTLLGIGLAVTGVLVVNLGADVAQGSGNAVWLGAGLVFGAVVCEATYSIVGKRLTVDLSPLQIVTAAAVLGAVLFAPLAVVEATSFSMSDPTIGQWIGLGWWGAGTMALGSWLWFRGMRRVRAATASAFMAVMPISALVGSYVLLGEAFQIVHAAGIAIALVGLAAVVRSGAPVH